MERETVEDIVSMPAGIIVTFERAVLTTGRTTNQGVAASLITLARKRLIEDLAILPVEAICEVRE